MTREEYEAFVLDARRRLMANAGKLAQNEAFQAYVKRQIEKAKNNDHAKTRTQCRKAQG